MSNFDITDLIALSSSLQKIAQAEPDPHTTRGIAIKRLQAIMGSNPNGVSTVADAEIKSGDLKSMDTLVMFLKKHNVAFNGTPIVSSEKHSDADEYWDGSYVNAPAMKGYLDHLHTEIKDPINLPLLNNITNQLNQNIGLGYKPQTKDKTAPEQSTQGPSQNQPTSQSKTTPSSVNAPFPMNGQSIDFTRLKAWLSAFNAVVSPAYQATVKRALQDLQWIVSASTAGWTPISLEGSPDTVYINVRDFWLHENPTVARNMPGKYFHQLAQLLGDVRGALEAFKSQGLDHGREEEFAQQFQDLQSAQITIGTWVDSLHQIQQRLDGANQ
jgi:hypothetical protein